MSLRHHVEHGKTCSLCIFLFLDLSVYKRHYSFDHSLSLHTNTLHGLTLRFARFIGVVRTRISSGSESVASFPAELVKVLSLSLCP